MIVHGQVHPGKHDFLETGLLECKSALDDLVGLQAYRFSSGDMNTTIGTAVVAPVLDL
ncbi:hypothetical protein SDC9_74964 [bioreactor metagenome]|uniref:Uncharacterized protein n=1 Tax=bioreactor metagenome TaxID=1076179 RepID=A0A644YKC5_9ZZZZ